MTPTTVSAILQLDYPDRLPKGKHNAPPTLRLEWHLGRRKPLLRTWFLRLEFRSIP